jgi:mono/diheme cytochrome c family protein
LRHWVVNLKRANAPETHSVHRAERVHYPGKIAMTARRSLAPIAFRLVIVAVACCTCAGALPAQNSSQNQQQQKVRQEVAAGKDVYMNARCFACHGEDGFGGVGPRFRENHFLGLTDYVIGQILIGRGIMPSFAEALSDQQIANVATYIRNSWGNQFGGVEPQQVVSVRNQLKVKPQQGPHVSSNEQPPGLPAPPPDGQPPGQPLPPPDMR